MNKGIRSTDEFKQDVVAQVVKLGSAPHKTSGTAESRGAPTSGRGCAKKPIASYSLVDGAFQQAQGSQYSVNLKSK